MALFSLYIGIQISLLLLMTLHDWINIPPLTNIEALAQYHTPKERLTSTVINTSIVGTALALTWDYTPVGTVYPLYVVAFLYGCLSCGSIMCWWVPYLWGHTNHWLLKRIYGPQEEYRKGFTEYDATHHFLPPHHTNLIPNTLHVILHLHIWMAFFLSLYFIIISL